jgi:hypothetical protein
MAGTPAWNGLAYLRIWRLFGMTILDLTKATMVCGGGTFLVYTFPILGQVLMIGLLVLLWLVYARQALLKLRRR